MGGPAKARIAELLTAVEERLRAAGIAGLRDDPQMQAEGAQLLDELPQTRRVRLPFRHGRPVPVEHDRLEATIERRRKHGAPPATCRPLAGAATLTVVPAACSLVVTSAPSSPPAAPGHRTMRRRSLRKKYASTDRFRELAASAARDPDALRP